MIGRGGSSEKGEREGGGVESSKKRGWEGGSHSGPTHGSGFRQVLFSSEKA